jgi:hypothetical protein
MARGSKTTYYKFVPWASVATLLLIAVSGAIAIGYTAPGTRAAGIETMLPGFYSHTSNVLISFGLVMTFGLLRLLYGARIAELAIFTAVVVISNYAYEMFLTLFNTKDIVDAHYGTVAALVAFALLAAIRRFGLRPSTPKSA